MSTLPVSFCHFINWFHSFLNFYLFFFLFYCIGYFSSIWLNSFSAFRPHLKLNTLKYFLLVFFVGIVVLFFICLIYKIVFHWTYESGIKLCKREILFQGNFLFSNNVVHIMMKNINNGIICFWISRSCCKSRYQPFYLPEDSLV